MVGWGAERDKIPERVSNNRKGMGCTERFKVWPELVGRTEDQLRPWF